MDIQYKKISIKKYEKWLIDNGFAVHQIFQGGSKYYRKQFYIGWMEFVVPNLNCCFDLDFNDTNDFVDGIVNDLLMVYSEKETKAIVESWYIE